MKANDDYRDSKEAIKRICCIPVDFRKGNKSFHELVHDTGIERRMLTAESVASALLSNPELVDDWLRWSEDQRSTPSHYFLEEKDKYVVGVYPGEESVEFSDRIAACADFIIKQVSSIL